MHEDHDAQFFRLGPEGIELAIRQFQSFDAATDGGSTKAQFSHRVIELLGGQIRMLQRQRRHPDEATGLRRDGLGRSFRSAGWDQIPRERALGRIAPGVDIDRR